MVSDAVYEPRVHFEAAPASRAMAWKWRRYDILFNIGRAHIYRLYCCLVA